MRLKVFYDPEYFNFLRQFISVCWHLPSQSTNNKIYFSRQHSLNPMIEAQVKYTTDYNIETQRVGKEKFLDMPWATVVDYSNLVK